MGNLLDCCSSKKRENNIEEENDFNSQLSAPEPEKEDQIEINKMMYKHMDEVLKPIKEERDLAMFDNLMLVFKTARCWSHTKFEKEKSEFIATRREALKNGNDQKYMEMAQVIAQAEQETFETTLRLLFKNLGFGGIECFNINLQNQMQTPQNQQAFGLIRQKAQNPTYDHLPKEEQDARKKNQMDKKECLAVQGKINDISFNLITSLTSEPTQP